MTNTTNMHPDEVHEALLSTAKHATKRRNLEIVHEVCFEQKKKGSTDFALSTIAGIVEARGGPRMKTMWNESCADYRKLIEAWQAYAGPPPFRELSKADTKQGLLTNIEDPVIRVVVENIIAQRDALRAEVNILKANAELVIDKRPLGAATTLAMSENSSTTVEIVHTPQLNLLEREALAHSISTEFWNAEGWKEEKNGRVVKELGDRNRTILKPGFVTAVRKVLNNK